MGSNTFCTKLTGYIQNISRNNKQEIFRSLPTLFEIHPDLKKYCDRNPIKITGSFTGENLDRAANGG